MNRRSWTITGWRYACHPAYTWLKFPFGDTGTPARDQWRAYRYGGVAHVVPIDAGLDGHIDVDSLRAAHPCLTGVFVDDEEALLAEYDQLVAELDRVRNAQSSEPDADVDAVLARRPQLPQEFRDVHGADLSVAVGADGTVLPKDAPWCVVRDDAAAYPGEPQARWLLPNTAGDPSTWEETLAWMGWEEVPLDEAVRLAALDGGNTVGRHAVVRLVLTPMVEAYTHAAEELRSLDSDLGSLGRVALDTQMGFCERFGDLLADVLGAERPDWKALRQTVVAAGEVAGDG